MLTAILCAAVAALGVAVAVLASYVLFQHGEARRLARENLGLRALVAEQNGLIGRQNQELLATEKLLRGALGKIR